MDGLDNKRRRGILLINLYPYVILIIAALINLAFFSVTFKFEIPTSHHLAAISIFALLICINHSWLMTTTEITRVKFKMYATPEEWRASGTSINDISEQGKLELGRQHNAHRNLTENLTIFLALAIPFILTSPPKILSYIFLIGFAVGRLGHTYSYLNGMDNLRGLFMSISLLSMYGVASYLILGLFGLFINS